MDLIDMQTCPDGEYKWLLVYQDHFTKFVQLRPLKNKSAVEVASALLDIFSIFGVPAILQSDNGREFRNQIVTALKLMWPDMQFVHGRARHPQSQGSTERANADIKKMLATWMRDNKSLRWSIGCKFVQLQKNHSFHSANKCSPYKAIFGIETPLGLQSTQVPKEKWAEMKTAKELFDICGIPYDGDYDVFQYEDADEQESFDVFEKGDMPQLEISHTNELDSEDHAALVEANANALMGIREAVRVGQAAQAEKMLTRSKKYLGPVEIGDFVNLPIPEVDRSLSSAPNLICRIVDIDYNHNVHELACEAGVLNVLFARNCFDKLDSTNLNVQVKMDKKVSVREAAGLVDIGGGQGMRKCNCTANCLKNSCTCKKNKLLCNSRCHHNNTSCKNK